MPFAIRASSGDFTPAPEGWHQARCIRVVDMGLQPSSYGEKHTTLLTWELPIALPNDPDRAFTVSKRYNVSMHESAKLREDLVSWRGRDFTPDELRELDLFSVLGIYATVMVIHTSPNSRGDVYANVTSVRPPEGPPFEGREQVIGISADECRPLNALALLGDTFAGKVREGLRRLRDQQRPPASVGASGQPGYADLDDEIPF